MTDVEAHLPAEGRSVRAGPPREDRPVVVFTDGVDADPVLAARLVAGDETALATVYDRHGGLVFGLARRVTQSDSAAQDITQEVFTSLWENPERFDPARGTMKAFLGVLTHRRSVDWVRRESAAHARAEREFRLSERVSFDGALDISEGAAADDTANRVRRAVAALPADQRQAIMLAYFGGLTYREVALELGIPEGTAKSRLRLGLGRLSAALAEQGITP